MVFSGDRLRRKIHCLRHGSAQSGDVSGQRGTASAGREDKGRDLARDEARQELWVEKGSALPGPKIRNRSRSRGGPTTNIHALIEAGSTASKSPEGQADDGRLVVHSMKIELSSPRRSQLRLERSTAGLGRKRTVGCGLWFTDNDDAGLLAGQTPAMRPDKV
ncbi:hypothetical protein [Amorphus orientalis]|uniref:Uncharacterized protein n=1 Tax=Amorphus orientalis TaxID=649198 RepID=A0AAE4ASD3_9HYPH|nr:hypothetical protein [Amorphus orientalis]MDQ0314910.1 hypothetical protein [Amorphus orientalis]